MDAIAASALHIRLDRYSANSRRKRQGGANQVRLQVPSLVDLVHQRVDLLVPGRVEPVRQSPRAIAYGFFAHGTDPHDRPYSSGIVSRADHLCRPPSPAHSAADRSVARLSPRFRYYSAVRRLARRRSPLRLPAYRVADPGATREPVESSWGHALIFRTVPSANTLIRWVDENAFAPILRARPGPTFGRPVHHGDGSPRLRPGTSPCTFRDSLHFEVRSDPTAPGVPPVVRGSRGIAYVLAQAPGDDLHGLSERHPSGIGVAAPTVEPV